MKGMLVLIALTAPRAAYAMPGPMHGGCGHHVHLAVALLGALAALGWWVLRHAEQDAGAVRWAGRAVGWVLLVVGLAGVLCGSLSHVRRALPCRCAPGMRGPDAMQMPSSADQDKGEAPKAPCPGKKPK